MCTRVFMFAIFLHIHYEYVYTKSMFNTSIPKLRVSPHAHIHTNSITGESSGITGIFVIEDFPF